MFIEFRNILRAEYGAHGFGQARVFSERMLEISRLLGVICVTGAECGNFAARYFDRTSSRKSPALAMPPRIFSNTPSTNSGVSFN